MFDILEADIVVMQETKIQRKDLRDDMVLVPGWDVYFSLPKHKKGSSHGLLSRPWTLDTRLTPINLQATPVSPYTPETRNAPRYAPKKA
jgi:exonuclease III